jgi:hypothetical protein
MMHSPMSKPNGCIILRQIQVNKVGLELSDLIQLQLCEYGKVR